MVTARDIAGAGIINFTKEVQVQRVALIGAGELEVVLSPNQNAQPDVTYAVALFLDGQELGLQGVSWTATEVSSGAVKTLVFNGSLSFADVSRIVVDVSIDPTVALISVGALSGIVGDILDIPVIMHAAPTGLSGFTLDADIVDPAVGRFVDVLFPSQFPLSTHTPDPVSGPTVQASGVDLNSVIQPGATDILLATLQVEALASGVTGVTATVTRLDDDGGFNVRRISLPGLVTVN